MKKEKKANPVSAFLDRTFKITERGSTVGQEAWAGAGAFCVAVCALLMNTQMIGTYYGNYAGSYFAVSLLTFIGTVVLGAVFNLPLMMTANLTLSTVMISMLGANTGLTYPNVLFVTFIAAVIALIVALTPLKMVLVDALPAGVRKALPVALGLYVIMTAVENTGLVSDGVLTAAQDYTNLENLYFWLAIAMMVLVTIYLAVKRTNAFGSTYFLIIAAMWVLGILFYLDYFLGGQTATTVVYQRLNLIVATDGASPYTIAAGISSLHIGQLFSEGLDFSEFTANGGNVALFIAQGVMTYLFLGMYTSLGDADGAQAAAGLAPLDAKTEKQVLITSSAANVVSPILGGSPLAVAPQSAMATKDGAKTGLSSVVAGIGFLIALFNWIFFALFVTGTNGVGMWINDTETKLAAYVQDSFLFADVIMIFVGIVMLKAVKEVAVDKKEEFLPFAAVLVLTVFGGNLVLGAAAGTILAFVLQLFEPDRKNTKLSFVLLTIIMIVYAYLVLQYGGDYLINTVASASPF